jgi:putative aldouronate transport system permease protein
VLCASVSDPILLARSHGLLLIPKGFTLKGYELVVRNPNITGGFMNTLFYVSVGTTLNLLLTSMGAYVCSRKGYAFSNFVIFMITFTMFFSGGLIPFYILVKGMGMTDTPWALIFPPAISAFNLIIMRTSFAAIPDSLEESARIDGANDFTILFRIIIPVSKAVVAVMVLLYAVGHWNSWFNAMIFLRNRRLYPLQLVLREILIQNDTNKITSIANSGNSLDIYKPLIKYSTIITSIVPIMCIYPFIQKYFVTAIMIGSLKG